MSKKTETIEPGLYHEIGTKRYYARPVNDKGRRTDYTFKATTPATAKAEFYKWKAEGEEVASKTTMDTLIQAYREANYPGAKMSQKKVAGFVVGEKSRCDSLAEFFGKMKAHSVQFKHTLQYRDDRVSKIKKSRRGGKTVDLDLGTLSNVFKHGLRLALVKTNPMVGRERFAGAPSLSRDHCCRDGDEVHMIANALAPALALQFLFECCSGVRTEEALSMRRDAKVGEAGHIRTEEGQRYICIKRAKQGDQDPFDYLLINPALELVLRAIDAYHAKLKKPSRWFFPGRDRSKDAVMDKGALSHALRRVAKKVLPGRSIHSHGCRAFYITWRVCQGASASQIAREVGHRSGVGLIEKNYFRRPAAWAGKDFGPYPKTEKAFWHGLDLLIVNRAEPQIKNVIPTSFPTSTTPTPQYATTTQQHMDLPSGEPMVFVMGGLQHTATR